MKGFKIRNMEKLGSETQKQCDCSVYREYIQRVAWQMLQNNKLYARGQLFVLFFEVIRIRGTTAANLNRINKNTFQMEIFKMEFTTVKHSQCQRVCLTYEQDYT